MLSFCPAYTHDVHQVIAVSYSTQMHARYFILAKRGPCFQSVKMIKWLCRAKSKPCFSDYYIAEMIQSYFILFAAINIFSWF